MGAVYGEALVKHFAVFNPSAGAVGKSLININWLTQDVYFIQGIIKPINQYLISHFNEQIQSYFYDTSHLESYDYPKVI